MCEHTHFNFNPFTDNVSHPGKTKTLYFYILETCVRWQCSVFIDHYLQGSDDRTSSAEWRL